MVKHITSFFLDPDKEDNNFFGLEDVLGGIVFTNDFLNDSFPQDIKVRPLFLLQNILIFSRCRKAIEWNVVEIVLCIDNVIFTCSTKSDLREVLAQARRNSLWVLLQDGILN